jgi:hypothetical protein
VSRLEPRRGDVAPVPRLFRTTPSGRGRLGTGQPGSEQEHPRLCVLATGSAVLTKPGHRRYRSDLPDSVPAMSPAELKRQEKLAWEPRLEGDRDTVDHIRV